MALEQLTYLSAEEVGDTETTVSIASVLRIVRRHQDGSACDCWMVTFLEFGFKPMILRQEDLVELDLIAGSGLVDDWVGCKVQLSAPRRLQIRPTDSGYTVEEFRLTEAGSESPRFCARSAHDG